MENTIAAEGRVLTCVYCGHEYPQATPAWGDKVLTDHIKVCPKHPMRELERKIELAVMVLRKIGIHASCVAQDAADCRCQMLDDVNDALTRITDDVPRICGKCSASTVLPFCHSCGASALYRPA